MRAAFLPLVALIAAGCAGTGANLQPGVSTLADVEESMGRPAEVQKAANGETTLCYPLPVAKTRYAARIAPEGRLIGVEQRMTEKNIAMIQLNQSTRAEVRALLGPPWRIDQYSRMQREVWTYPVYSRPMHKELYVQFSPDGVVRESWLVIDPDEIKNSGPGRD